MNGLLTRPDEHIASTDDQVHHHGAAVPGTVSLALCGARRLAMTQQQARELPCCPDCAELITLPCGSTIEEAT